jgi:hypothetical protein
MDANATPLSGWRASMPRLSRLWTPCQVTPTMATAAETGTTGLPGAGPVERWPPGPGRLTG